MDDLVARVGARLLRSRRVVRAPIWLYRHGAGWLLGHRILLLEHIGRTTGLPRYVCLEVVEQSSADTILVCSGFGVSSQWYQNLQANPACHVSTGRRQRVPATARDLSRTEVAQALARYQRAHPRAWRQLRQTVEIATGQQLADMPMVELSLRGGDSPAGRS